ncbi:MAG: bis(5'-nucleosyl)-tetraphosphatase (symmetrical) YqeK [Thermoleophilia bacterium]
MIDRIAAEELIGQRLSPRRREHSRRVADTAAALARDWGASPAAAYLAGVLHDLWREASATEILEAAVRYGIPVGPIEARRPVGLLHGPVAAAELRGAGLDDEVASAIALHTVGGRGMNVLEKCVYLADLCEPGRTFDGLDEIRALAGVSLDAAVAAAARLTILMLLERGRPVVPAAVELYNEHYVDS